MALDNIYKAYLDEVRTFIPENRVQTDDLMCLAWGTDASFYREIPKMVIHTRNEEEVSKLLQLSDKYNLPVTFRAAGTSLSGQSVTDSILIVAGQHWEKYHISKDGETITLEPGIVGDRVNQILKPYDRIFSPDPASKKSAMVGGIVMNNASGMNCGTHANSDRILKSLRMVMADGTILDTGDERSRKSFSISHAAFIKKIEELRDRVNADEELVKRINHKYAIKNVTGLNILPFVRFTDPFDIMAHLLVGSEGTLAFGSEFKMATGHNYKYSASAMLYFENMREASEAVVAIKDSPIHSAEMLDPKSLKSVNDPNGVGDVTAVLTETKADSEEELQKNIAAILEKLAPFKLTVPAYFTDKPEEYSKYWAIRSGIFPSVGGMRPVGTTVIIEDVAFHIEDLPNATTDLADMLVKHGYEDSCIYGHALEGNYHFIISQSFNTQADIDKYKNLMTEIEHLVVDKYDGSLKAEHGTGRNMAPFVKNEWGEKTYEIMKEVKQLFDPKNLLNPGVIFNDDPECFIKNIKALPPTSAKVDKCIECGFCEVNCLTTGLTLSARQRIVVQREISRLRATGEDNDRMNRLIKAFDYNGNKTCAGDGLCGLSCPMGIKAGAIVHDLREQNIKGTFGYKVGEFAANHLSAVKGALRPMLSLASVAQNVIGDKAVDKVGEVLHKAGVPLWTSSLPKAHYADLVPEKKSAKKVVYFPSCINQAMGVSKNDPNKCDLVNEMVRFLEEKGGYEVIYPDNMDNLCCGMIWASKGMPEIANRKTKELEAALLKASNNGQYPVLCDQSPCLLRMRTLITSMHLYEPVEFIYDLMVPELEFIPTDEPVAVHVTCSMRNMGVADKVVKLAQMCSNNVIIPEGVGCCGFAGDRGFNYPEVNRYALRKLAPQLQKANVKRGFSNSRTCEIGLTTNSGVPYQSIVYLVDECTKRK